MNTIVHLIRQKQLTNVQREKINKILYKCYEKMAIKQAVLFKKKHHHKCKSIHSEDLILSSKVGLLYSINKYNGSSSFIKFARFYIEIELLKILTSHFSSSSVPKYIRMKSKKNFSKYELYKYNLETFTYLDYSQMNNICISEQENLYQYKEIWEQINGFDSFSKRVIYLKYDFEFNKIRTNEKIAQLMCCSKEHIRKKIKNILLV